MHLFLYAYPQVEICNLNQIYTTTDTLYPFRYIDYCSAVYVDGSCKVLSEDGFVRIILIDNNEEEWLNMKEIIYSQLKYVINSLTHHLKHL